MSRQIFEVGIVCTCESGDFYSLDVMVEIDLNSGESISDTIQELLFAQSALAGMTNAEALLYIEYDIWFDAVKHIHISWLSKEISYQSGIRLN